jgi:hypothetical protein
MLGGYLYSNNKKKLILMPISSFWKNKVHGGNSEFLSYKKKCKPGKYFLNHLYIYIMVFYDYK